MARPRSGRWRDLGAGRGCVGRCLHARGDRPSRARDTRNPLRPCATGCDSVSDGTTTLSPSDGGRSQRGQPCRPCPQPRWIHAGNLAGAVHNPGGSTLATLPALSTSPGRCDGPLRKRPSFGGCHVVAWWRGLPWELTTQRTHEPRDGSAPFIAVHGLRSRPGVSRPGSQSQATYGRVRRSLDRIRKCILHVGRSSCARADGRSEGKRGEA